MRRLVVAVLALLGVLPLPSLAVAQEPEAVPLWPGRAPGANGDDDRDVPRLLRFPPPAGRPDGEALRPAIVVCPGGGYGHLAMGHEGRDIAAWLHRSGIEPLVLDYRHRGKGYGHPWPLRDAQRALRLARHRAAEWRIDPQRIGVLGFSAGGHLAASASVYHDAGAPENADVVERQSCRPDFAVLCYPVIAFGQEFSHRGSQQNLLGRDAAAELVARMSVERQVDETTPPTFLWHTSADRGVSAENSLVYYRALLRHRVPCELHVFEAGRHGIGLGGELPAAAWATLCRRWLRARGVLAD